MCSGEGTLSAFDIRKHKLLLQSELLDSGLLSVAIIKVIRYFIALCAVSDNESNTVTLSTISIR